MQKNLQNVTGWMKIADSVGISVSVGGYVMNLKEQIEDIITEVKADTKFVQSHPFGAVELIKLRIFDEVVDGLAKQLTDEHSKHESITTSKFINGYQVGLEFALGLLQK